jgi:hypothetical protein
MRSEIGATVAADDTLAKFRRRHFAPMSADDKFADV